MQLNHDFKAGILELIRRTSSELPDDVIRALIKARDQEEQGSAAQNAFKTILLNIEMARHGSTPICQDTGTPVFYVDYPVGISTLQLRQLIREAIDQATAKTYLRPNAVHAITGKNSGNNLGNHFPVIHFEEWEKPDIRLRLLLKGGGSENVGTQYSLPNAKLGADRNLAGVKKVLLDAVYQAQGKGCAPGTLGVGIGGDRETSYKISKQQFFRDLADENSDPALAALEREVLEKANQLGIGPMGFGGNATLLGVKAGFAHRLPACYFVSVSYMCWADRRRTMIYRDGEVEII